LLFLNPDVLAEHDGVRLTVNPPRREAVDFPPRQPWERMRGLYLSVMEDGDRLRMWYGARSGAGETDKHVCYAESDDGVVWWTPELGLAGFRGSTANNLLSVNSMEGAVFRDPTAPADSRYRATWQLLPEGLTLFTSPDGLRWTARGEPLLKFWCDSANVALWDEQIGKYVGYVRAWKDGPPSVRRRKVARWEADSIDEPLGVEPVKEHPRPDRLPHVTTELPIVMECDGLDPPDTDIYTNAVVPYPLAPRYYCAFPVFYHHFPEPDEGPYQNSGRTETHFMGSTDGVTWHRYDRCTYAGPRPDENMLYVGHGLVARDDEIWQYGVAYHTPHGRLERRLRETDGTICRFVQRLDGFVSVDAGYRGARFVTRPVELPEGCLWVNADAGALGSLRVGLRDEEGRAVPGFSMAECVTVEGNGTRLPVRWESARHLGELAGRRLRLAVEMSRCKLYSFAFGEPC
jgi:hypothetical protein